MGKHRAIREPVSATAKTQPDLSTQQPFHIYTENPEKPYYITDEIGDAISVYMWLINEGEPRVVLDYMK